MNIIICWLFGCDLCKYIQYWGFRCFYVWIPLRIILINLPPNIMTQSWHEAIIPGKLLSCNLSIKLKGILLQRPFYICICTFIMQKTSSKPLMLSIRNFHNYWIMALWNIYQPNSVCLLLDDYRLCEQYECKSFLTYCPTEINCAGQGSLFEAMRSHMKNNNNKHCFWQNYCFLCKIISRPLLYHYFSSNSHITITLCFKIVFIVMISIIFMLQNNIFIVICQNRME